VGTAQERGVGCCGFFGSLGTLVKRPVSDFVTTLEEISHTLIRQGPLIYSTFAANESLASSKENNDRLRELHEKLRDQHAKLLSSTTAIPKGARRLLTVVGFLRSDARVQRGADALAGLSNLIIDTNKDRVRLIELVVQVGEALRIEVGQKAV
jgi:hypothetical protein